MVSRIVNHEYRRTRSTHGAIRTTAKAIGEITGSEQTCTVSDMLVLCKQSKEKRGEEHLLAAKGEGVNADDERIILCGRRGLMRARKEECTRA